MYTVYRTLAVILCLASAALAQVHPRVNLAHPLAEGLLQWHIAALPSLAGPQWLNLMGTRHGTLTNMAAGFGWVSTLGGISPGALRCDGVDDYVGLPSTTAFDFVNTSFTVSGRFRATTPAALGYLISNRLDDTGGSFYIRMNTDGTLLAALRAPGGNVATRNTVGAYGNDAWHTFNVIFTTDTTTAGGNNGIGIVIDGVPDQAALGGLGVPYAAPVTTVGLCTQTASAPQNYFAGALDNIMIHARDLFVAPGAVAAYQQMQWPTYGGLLLPSDVTVLPFATITGPVRPKRKVVIQ